MSEDGAKHYKVKIDEANLFVRKMTVSDNVVGAIEKTLLKTTAMYRDNEVISKAFLKTAGQQSWKQEDNFTKEPIRRLIIAMSPSAAFIGTNTEIPFSYRNFGLNEITVYRNEFSTAGTPMSTRDDKKGYTSIQWEPWLSFKMVTVFHWLISHVIIERCLILRLHKKPHIISITPN